MLLFLLFGCIQEPKIEVDTGQCEASVTDVAKGLTIEQYEVSETIEEELTQLEIPQNIIAAAIVNAIAESSLNPDAIGDGGKAVGAFQLHKKGLGKNLSVDDRRNIYTNTNVIGIQILKNDKLFALNENGEEIPELSAVFAEEIMKPANIEDRKEERRKIANKIFPKRL
ncbi:MAG: hypothetical protein RIR47_95 [Bacteroidota bacterium]|jgi:hypothetical protein